LLKNVKEYWYYKKYVYLYNIKTNNMKKIVRKQYTNEELKLMLTLEIEKCGQGVWSDRRKTLEEMLRMRGVI
jgi:hypothetical protein